MIAYSYSTTTPVPPNALYEAIADIASWPTWDPDIEMTEAAGAIAAGQAFVLKPRGGPKVRMTIAAADRPTCFVDLAHLPLAQMRTTHLFEPADGATRVTVRIEVRGLLGFLWDRIVARKQSAGSAEQTRRFIAHAATLA
jgi:hypothetical protein